MATLPHSTAPSGGLTLRSVEQACEVLHGVIWPTPLIQNPALDELTGYHVWLKPENLQRTGSYKIRGAYNKLYRLKMGGGSHKIIAASAGNHAQGVAYAARELGMDCVIVMPERAPLPKRRATARYGVSLVLEGNSFDDSLAYALREAPLQGREFISPYNDLDVITGQATIAWEIVEELRDSPPDAVIVPVGGGGLIAGVASVLKQRLPQTRVIAVQSSRAPAFTRSWAAYRQRSQASPVTPLHLPLDIPTEETIADGVRVRRPGELCWQMARDLVDQSLTVDDARIYAGILFLLEQVKVLAEGAGALGVAALLDGETRKAMEQAGVGPGARVVVLVTGGNIDSLTLQRVLERSLASGGRSQAIAVRIKDEPGQLGHILEFLRRKRASVLDLRRSWRISPLISDMADVEILIETEDERHARQVLQELAQEAKTHNFVLLSETAAGVPSEK
jgi:threonine dehydratase